MKILFLSYWGLHDPLTVSTVFPHLKLLQEMPQVEQVMLVTIEREDNAQILQFQPPYAVEKIIFRPLYSANKKINLLNKIDDFLRFPGELIKLTQQFKSDSIIARGAPAGALAYLAWKKTRTPFYVESYEPHADYMYDSGIWPAYDPRYIFEQYWEKKQKQKAAGIMPVAESYRQKLITEGVPTERLVTVPCSVDLERFRFDEEARAQVRQRLRIASDTNVGVYVGKFGGMYYEQEAFQLFRATGQQLGGRFFLVILTPNDKAQVEEQLRSVGFAENDFFVHKATHAEVPAYLSAADIGFATVKPVPSRQYCSLVKVGEYWAAGLPVLLTEGVSDDSHLIKQKRAGATFSLADPATISRAITDIASILREPAHRSRIAELAAEQRTVNLCREAYAHFLG